MKKIFLFLFLLMAGVPAALSQDGTVTYMRRRPSTPSTCITGGFYLDTTAAVSRECVATDTWLTKAYLNKAQSWLKTQTIQPDTDSEALVLKCFDGTNTASVLTVKDNADATVFSVQCDGTISADAGVPSLLQGTVQTSSPTLDAGYDFGIYVDSEGLKCKRADGSSCLSTGGSGYTTAPASPTDSGSAGQWAADGTYFYAYASGGWHRLTWESWTTPQVATPTFSPDGSGNPYNNDQSVTISDATSGATIKYCTGSACDPFTGTSYASAISVTADGTIIRAGAQKSGMDDSPVGQLTINLKAATPTYSPDGGTSTGTVTIATATTGASTFYCFDTANTCTPTTSGSSYDVTDSGYLRSIATKSSYQDSNVKSAHWTIGGASLAQVQKVKGGIGVDAPSAVSSVTIGSGDGLAPFTAGNLVVVQTSVASANDRISSVSDGVNTYIEVGAPFSYANNCSSPFGRCVQIFYAYNVSSASSVTVNSMLSGKTITAVIREYSGVRTSSDPLRAWARGADSGTQATDFSTANMTGLSSGDLLVGGCSQEVPPFTSTALLTNSWSDKFGYQVDGVDTHASLVTGEIVSYGSSADKAFTMIVTDAAYFGCRVAAFIPAP